MAAMAAEQGTVSTHPHTIRPATPHLTALKRRSEPTPMMAPVIVWVVLTGIPSCVERKSMTAALVSAQNPSTGLSLVTLCPIVLTIRHPPIMVPSAIAPWHERTTHRGM